MTLQKGLEQLGIRPKGDVYKNLPVANLVEEALKKGEGYLAANGALVVRTGERTGRSPLDRFIVEESTTSSTIDWNKINQPISEDIFDRLYKDAADYISGRDIFVFDGFIGANKSYRLPLRVVTVKAWHSLFVQTLFIRPTAADLSNHKPEFHVVNAFGLKIDPKKYGLKSEAFVAINFKKKVILAIGTGYGGEMKKGVFSVMNYLLPERGIFPMHCSANVGVGGDAALFFGLSGTGKTTLSADPERRLIGDDEHGWGDIGIFNFEGGCYAKVIRLSATAEPQIFNAIKFGSILENVVTRDDRGINYDSAEITENTRATYPVEYIPNCITEGVGGHPKNIFFLTCDAFGVLPPISKLTTDQAMRQFISGYTAKIAGTEVGIVEPQVTFSACFGAPFLPRHPTLYSGMLSRMLKKYRTDCWLVNTGWSGGGYGVGKRMGIQITRNLLTAALGGSLAKAEFKPDPVFGLMVPGRCEGVPADVLAPKNTWKDKTAYDAGAKKLALLFEENFKKYKI